MRSIENSSSVDTYAREKAQTRTSDRRQVRVKFAYSLDNDRLSPITQTTVIESEPYFKVTATEDEITKHFYQNKSPIIPRQQKTNQSIQQRILNGTDNLQDEYSSKKETETIYTISSSIKPILKKSQKKEKEEISIPNIDRSLTPRSMSLTSASKNRQTSSTRSDLNDVQHLAEATAKQKSSLPPTYCRSLFSQTMNIFDPDNPYDIRSNNRRPSRFQYYIKPYRGEPDAPTNLNKNRSRSLPQSQFTQASSSKTRWHTFSNQYARPSTRKQHISWSPVRQYIHEGRDDQTIRPTKRRRILSGKNPSTSLSTIPFLSSTNPSFIIPIPIHFRRSQSSQFPSPCSSTEFYDTPSTIDCSLTSLKPGSSTSYYKEEKTCIVRTSSSHLIDKCKTEHKETLQQYDRLLEKMRTTDKELQVLSRSWTNNVTKRIIPVNNDCSADQQVSETYEIQFLNG